jgi:hypothetical protein
VRIIARVALACLLMPAVALADDDDAGADAEADAGEIDAAPPQIDAAPAENDGGVVRVVPPPPEGFGALHRLRDDDYERKNEGGYFTGVPIANYDPTTRFGFGARIYYYWNGYRDDPRFAYTPYLTRVIAQTFLSTGSAQDHLLDFDAPLFLGSLYRVRATLEYEATNAWPYFGIGSRSLNPLSFPGAPGVTFEKASHYNDALRNVQPDGTTYAYYNTFILRRPTLLLGLERVFLGGTLRPFFGLGFSYNYVGDYTGREVDGHPQAQTLLAADCAAGIIKGCNGGWDNTFRLALSYDTRDFEPDPNNGVYAELSTEWATRALGSDFDYVRAMLSIRGFYSPIPKIADVVLAVRAVYEVQSSGAAFFSLENMPFIDDDHAGLGGVRTLRGYVQNRFVGPIIALTNYEVRWTFTHVKLLKQDFGLMVVPFMDIGRVFDRVSQTTLAGWKRTQGAGFRVGWNEATIIAADFGFSEEDSGLYINFNHIF